MVAKSVAVLNAEVAADAPDNTTGLITPAQLRTMLLDIIASYPNLVDTPPAGTLLNTITIAGPVASVQDTTSFLSGYLNYTVTFDHVLPSGGAPNLLLRIQSGGVFPITGYTPSDPAITIGSPNSNAHGCSGTLRFYSPAQVSICVIEGQMASSAGIPPLLTLTQPVGAWNTAAVVTGFQILCSAGQNLQSGTIKVYGAN